MRRTIGTLIILVVEAAGSVVLETTIIPTLFNPPWLFVLFGVLVVTAVGFWMPEIKGWLDPTARIIRRGKARYEQDRASRLKARIRAAHKTGILRDIRYDPATDRITGDIIRRSWKGRWIGYGIWFANHRVLPAPVFIWLAKRMGYTIREAEKNPLEE